MKSLVRYICYLIASPIILFFFFINAIAATLEWAFEKDSGSWIEEFRNWRHDV